jgi:hypothetical protein
MEVPIYSTNSLVDLAWTTTFGTASINKNGATGMPAVLVGLLKSKTSVMNTVEYLLHPGF